MMDQRPSPRTEATTNAPPSQRRAGSGRPRLRGKTRWRPTPIRIVATGTPGGNTLTSARSLESGSDTCIAPRVENAHHFQQPVRGILRHRDQRSRAGSDSLAASQASTSSPSSMSKFTLRPHCARLGREYRCRRKPFEPTRGIAILLRRLPTHKHGPRAWGGTVPPRIAH